MKVSDYIVEFLFVQGVNQIFELVGGMTTHMVDSIHRHGKIKLVSMHHEQAASFAADAIGRVTHIPGVAMATSGPGATNLLTGIGSCYFDSSPAIFITGQVNRHEQKGNRAIRQLGFQEADIVAMARPITKAAWRVESPEKIPTLLVEAFTIALSGRPGPVLIDLPMDVQRADISAQKPWHLSITNNSSRTNNSSSIQIIEDVLNGLKFSQKPLILAGGGVNVAHAIELFRKFVDVVKVPVVSSLMGVDVLPFEHPLRVGMIGSYGNRWANLAVGRCDFLLVLGSRLDVRQTGYDTVAFKTGREIYHVDCEADEINNRVLGCHPVISDIRIFLESAMGLLSSQNMPMRVKWLSEIMELKDTWHDTSELHDISGINPNEFMHQLSSVSHLSSSFVVDVGQNQMWAAQSLDLCANQRFITSGGMGAMGFALPAAIGVAFGLPKYPVVVIAGDGAFQLNIQELQTIKHHQLPIKIIVINNQCYGMVRQFQQSYFDERYVATLHGYSTPNFVHVAEAYGITALSVNDPKEVLSNLEIMWQEPYRPFLLEIMIDKFVNVYPKLAFGKPITEMEPFAKPTDMEST